MILLPAKVRPTSAEPSSWLSLLALMLGLLASGCAGLSPEGQAARNAELRVLAESRRQLELAQQPPDQDRTRGTTNACPVHRRTMSVRRVAITYGLVRGLPPVPSLETRTALFPFGETSVLGGCCVGVGMPTHARVFICPVCVTARAQWFAEAKLAKPRATTNLAP